MMIYYLQKVLLIDHTVKYFDLTASNELLLLIKIFKQLIKPRESGHFFMARNDIGIEFKIS
jgi:hypothetical protein